MAMMVVVPEWYRVLAQIWNWPPWRFLSPWNVFDQYTISILGHHFTSWQAVPIIYRKYSNNCHWKTDISAVSSFRKIKL